MFSSLAPKNLASFLRADKKVKISNFTSWFSVKDKFLEQKIDTAVPCPDTEGSWKVSPQSELWFPIQPKKEWVNFPQAGKKSKIPNFVGWFCLKDKLLGQKTDTAVSCPDTEGL